MEVHIHTIRDSNPAGYQYVVLCVRCMGQWLFVRHKERLTWEMPGGHVEPGEEIRTAALRELYEETGIISCGLFEVCEYTVDDYTDIGRLYLCLAEKPGVIPEYEIAEYALFDTLPVNSTYYPIYQVLFPLAAIMAEERARAEQSPAPT